MNQATSDAPAQASPPEFPASMSTSTNLFSGPQRLPFAQRIKVEVTVGALKVAATLMDSTEVDKLIRILEANKLLLTEEMGEA